MITELIETLLRSRGVTEETKDAFLNPDYDRDTHSPFLLADMDRAVERILRAMAVGEYIALYADFDCDGIPGAVVMHDFFKKIGYEKKVVYIPDRHTEGYGLHTHAIDALHEKSVSLIITIDLGCTAHDSVLYASSKGIDVIVTDHHELSDTLPAAYAVINPKRAGYPFSDLCGAAVAFKVVCALLSEGKKRALPPFVAVNEGWEKWLLDMVGLATIADMVPLVGENRVYAKYGITVLRKSRRPGLLALCRSARVQQPSIDEETIGYVFAPRINAASRMDSPMVAFTLFATDDISEAETAAKKLESLNRQRKGYAGALTKEVKGKIAEWETVPPVIVTGSPHWKPALLGSVAATIVEEYGRPVFLWGREGNGVLKGSCRGDGSVHLTELLKEIGDTVLQYGGHEHAGGFSVSEHKIHTLPQKIEDAYQRLKKINVVDVGIHDGEVPLVLVKTETYRTLQILAPFGVGNSRPSFMFRGVTIVSVRQFGSDGQHCEVIVSDGSKEARAYSFFAAPHHFSHHATPGAVVNMVGSLSRNTFSRGMPIEIVITDIHAHE